MSTLIMFPLKFLGDGTMKLFQKLMITITLVTTFIALSPVAYGADDKIQDLDPNSPLKGVTVNMKINSEEKELVIESKTKTTSPTQEEPQNTASSSSAKPQLTVDDIIVTLKAAMIAKTQHKVNSHIKRTDEKIYNKNRYGFFIKDRDLSGKAYYDFDNNEIITRAAIDAVYKNDEEPYERLMAKIDGYPETPGKPGSALQDRLLRIRAETLKGFLEKKDS